MRGIDVSNHNNDINWKEAKKELDFVIIRAGFGKNNIDGKAVQNVRGCIDNKIPYGLYWFSYATTVDMAKKEADYLCDFADDFNPTYPLCYDWEYDSDNFASKQGIKMTNNMRIKFAEAFLSEVENRGYYAMLYTNIDYLKKGFDKLRNKYDIWLAQWGVKEPSLKCGIWQRSDRGICAGISGNVDTNISYKNYPSIITKNANINIKSQYDKIKKEYTEKYIKIATDIIGGKYGNGEERKKKLTALGYDYNLAQDVVNCMLGIVT